jgi:uncharacterized protein DUF2344
LIKFGPPLPVGIEGEHELLDLCLTHLQNGWVRNLDGHMPPGVRIHRAEMVGVSAPEAIDRSVDRMDYRIVLPTVAEGGPQEEIVAPLVAAFLEQSTYIHLRRRPKGDVEIDVRPMVADDGLKVIENAGDGHGPVLALSLSWRADKPGLPVMEFIAALFGDALVEPRHSRVRRTDMLMQSDDATWVSPLERIREQNTKRWLRKHLSA